MSVGQRVASGDELYRVADLGHVWVMAEAFGADGEAVAPGASARVSIAGRSATFAARVSRDVPPQFDRDSQSATLRVEVDNPGAVLRPDMFVDVAIAMPSRSAIAVPADAMIDSGFTRTVFVERSAGVFEPRDVETGRRGGDRVEIVKGLDGRRAHRRLPARSSSTRGAAAHRHDGRRPGAAVIAEVIALSARHRVAVVLATVAAAFAGWWSMRRVPLDAIPDLSDTQVIVYSRWDRSPDLVEDQVTYPIVTALLGAPRVKAVRGFSDFGYSYVYVIFEDGTDIYWARSRTLEYLSAVLSRLPQGVTTELGPDATGLGWVFQYALVDESGTHSLADLRSLPGLVPPLSPEVPSAASPMSRRSADTCRQYQVNVDPNRLRAYGLPIGARRRGRARAATTTSAAG